MPRESINVSSYHVPVAAFTHAVRAPAEGTFVFVSGLTARTPDGGIAAEGDPEGQARLILQTLTRILADAGATPGDVVRIVTYLVDMEAPPPCACCATRLLRGSPTRFDDRGGLEALRRAPAPRDRGYCHC